MMRGAASTKMSTNQFREFAGAVLRSLPDDLDETVAQGWVENQESLRRILREALSEDKLANSSAKAEDPYLLVVDYGRSVEDAVNRGRYDYWASGVNKRNFSTERTGKADIAVELVHFNRYISMDDALRELDKMGYRPAELHELLAFGEKYLDVQREFPIIALGSVWRDRHGDRRVPCLNRNGSKRNLNLGWIEYDWNEICRFAAVRK